MLTITEDRINEIIALAEKAANSIRTTGTGYGFIEPNKPTVTVVMDISSITRLQGYINLLLSDEKVGLLTAYYLGKGNGKEKALKDASEKVYPSLEIRWLADENDLAEVLKEGLKRAKNLGMIK
jgi:hypothetical protein